LIPQDLTSRFWWQRSAIWKAWMASGAAVWVFCGGRFLLFFSLCQAPIWASRK